MQDDDATPVIVGAEADAPRARDEDVAALPPAVADEAAQLGGRQLRALGPEERGPERREMERDAVAFEPREVLPFLERAVLQAQEDFEHELREQFGAIAGEMVRRDAARTATASGGNLPAAPR